MDACKTNVQVRPYGADFRERFVSGHDFSRAVKIANDEGFSPCGSFFRVEGPFRSSKFVLEIRDPDGADTLQMTEALTRAFSGDGQLRLVTISRTFRLSRRDQSDAPFISVNTGFSDLGVAMKHFSQWVCLK